MCVCVVCEVMWTQRSKGRSGPFIEAQQCITRLVMCWCPGIGLPPLESSYPGTVTVRNLVNLRCDEGLGYESGLDCSSQLT